MSKVFDELKLLPLKLYKYVLPGVKAVPPAAPVTVTVESPGSLDALHTKGETVTPAVIGLVSVI